MSTAPTPLTPSMRRQLNRIDPLNVNEETTRLLNMIVANPHLDDESRQGIVDEFKQANEHAYDDEKSVNFGLVVLSFKQPSHEQHFGKMAELIFQTESPGILNWLLEGRAKLA